MNLKTFFVVALMLTSAIARAQSPSDLAEAFLVQVATANSDEAYDQLFKGSGMAENKPQIVEVAKRQTKLAMGLYGTMIGIEKVDEKALSPSLVRLVYLQKFDKLPLAWEFYFYRAQDTWVLNHVLFNDQVALIIK